MGVNSHPPQFRHPANLDPLHDEDIAVVIEACPVRADELTGDELVARFAAQRIVPLRRVRVAELRYERVALVHERHAAVQVGNDDQALVLVEMAGESKPGNEVDVLAVEREALQSVVAPVGDDDHGRVGARIDPDAMRFCELARL